MDGDKPVCEPKHINGAFYCRKLRFAETVLCLFGSRKLPGSPRTFKSEIGRLSVAFRTANITLCFMANALLSCSAEGFLT